jgi:hypothetical protein
VRVPSRIASLAFPVIASLVVACSGTSPTSPPSAAQTVAPSAAPGGGSPSPATSPSPGAGAVPGLLLEVASEGGFINPASRLGDVPSVVVDDDGRIYTPGAPAGDTQPLVAPVDVRDVGAAGAAAIRDAIQAAGLDREEPGGGGIVADTGTTVFTTLVDGDTVVNRFAAAGPAGPGSRAPGGSPVPGASGDPATAAFALLARLTDPSETWGSAAPTTEPYRAAGYRVFAAPVPTDAGSSQPPAPAWPLATPLASFGTPAAANFGLDGLRSGIVTGADAATLAPLLQSLPAGASVASGGQPWTLWVRPLFPDELGA